MGAASGTLASGGPAIAPVARRSVLTLDDILRRFLGLPGTRPHGDDAEEATAAAVAAAMDASVISCPATVRPASAAPAAPAAAADATLADRTSAAAALRSDTDEYSPEQRPCRWFSMLPAPPLIRFPHAWHWARRQPSTSNRRYTGFTQYGGSCASADSRAARCRRREIAGGICVHDPMCCRNDDVLYARLVAQ